MLKRLLLLLAFGVSLHAQCVLNFTLSSNGRSQVFDNRSDRCSTWSVTFAQSGRPAMVILQSAESPGGPWSVFPGSFASSDSSGVIVATGAPSYVSVIKSPVGNGTLTGTLLGVVLTPASVTVNGKTGNIIALTSSDIPEETNLYYTVERVQNVLSAWPGSGAITAVGTLTSGTIPWARLGDVPATFTPAPHSHTVTDLSTSVPWSKLSDVPSLFSAAPHSHPVSDLSTVGDYSSKITLGTYSISVTGNAATVTNGVYNNGSYTDPTWIASLAKSKVGLGSVENTALSTWAGSANVTTIGTLVAGTVPWARLSNVPTSFTASPHTHPVADLSTVGDYSSKITSGTYSINITGSAASATNATTVAGLAVSTGGVAPGVNQIVRTHSDGYTYLGWLNTVSGDAGTNAITRVYASYDAWVRYYTLANFAKQATNAVSHDGSFAWNDQYIALPTGTVVWGVFQPRAAQATITEVVCWADTGDAVIQLRRNDGGDLINSNLLCNGVAKGTADLNNGYQVIPIGNYLGVWEVSGTAKSIRVGFKYTTAY